MRAFNDGAQTSFGVTKARAREGASLPLVHLRGEGVDDDEAIRRREPADTPGEAGDARATRGPRA